MEKQASPAASNTTYHSFDLFEPASPPRHHGNSNSNSPQKQYPPTKTMRAPVRERRTSAGSRIQRQDSGYESLASPRSSSSHPRALPARRSSDRPRTGGRPSMHRASKTHPPYRTSAQSLHMQQPPQQPPQFAYFQFPPPEVERGASLDRTSVDGPGAEEEAPPQPCSLPPQPTHYWTSDRTRRLEYAAIDAATRGFKGWVLRNLVPDCFAPTACRHHVSFDDDSGSVRRYRLDLEDDDPQQHQHQQEDDDEKTAASKARRRKAWHFWGARKSTTV